MCSLCTATRLIGLLLTTSTVAMGTASFQGLGPLPEGMEGYSYAYAVSADGSVVVGSMYSAASYHPFRWATATGIVAMGHLEGGTYGSARGVSADGSVIVGSSDTAAHPNDVEPFRWTETDGMVSLGYLPGSLGRASALAVSASGSVVVGGDSVASGGAFRWTQTDGMVNLGNLAGGSSSWAAAVSADGSVVVGAGDSLNFQTQAFRWTQNGGMVGLGTIPGGPSVSFARAVSADGRVVVGAIGAPTPVEAFRWTESDGMVGLGHLPGGESESDAYGVSGDGSIVVGSGMDDSVSEHRAFIWDEAHGMRYLGDVLVEDYHLDMGSWVLHEALAISSDGRTIVGWGRHGDVAAEGFIVRLPEPTTLLLLALCGLAMMRRRVRRHSCTFIPVVVAALLLSAASARAMSMETVTVGDPANAADTRYETPGYGSVGYVYSIGKYEVTAGQYCEFLNAVATTDTYGLYNPRMNYDSDPQGFGCNIKRSGNAGSYTYTVAPDWANRPVNWVSWGDAARFANWLHNGQRTGAQGASTTENGAYALNGATTDAALLAVTRTLNWKWAITSEAEWYKAAYYKGGSTNAGYWDYPTSNDSVPSNVLGNPTDPGNNATYYDHFGTGNGTHTIGGPYYRTESGSHENSDSAYSTFDQGGNVWEWNEAVLYGSARGLRGGSFDHYYYSLSASERDAFYHADVYGPSFETDIVGFRVVEVPEPATLIFLALGGPAMVGRRHPQQ